MNNMTINKIEISGDNIVITLDSNAAVNKLYIDNLFNISNKYSSKDEDHCYTIDNPDVENNVITINYIDLGKDFDASAFTVLIDGVLGFYYNDKELYYAQVDLLTTYCSTCLDKHLKEKILLFLMKYYLLQYAVDNELIDDLILYYTDIARMLNISLNNGKIIKTNNCCNNVKCCNGCCTLC